MFEMGTGTSSQQKYHRYGSSILIEDVFSQGPSARKRRKGCLVYSLYEYLDCGYNTNEGMDAVKLREHRSLSDSSGL